MHIVLDDMNTETSSVAWCLEHAKHEECRHLARLLLRMSRTQREKLARQKFR